MTEKRKVADYVYVEMIFNDPKKHDVISGLFKGILEYKGSTYIALKGLGNTTSLINLKFYNIMTIEVMEEEYRNMSFCTHEEEDQIKALGMLKKQYEDFQEADLMVKKGGMLIDVTKYINVPKDYKEGKELNSKVSSGTGQYTAGHTRYAKGATGSAAYQKTEVKPDPKPAVLKRSSKKPTRAELEQLSELIDQIANKEVVLPLPETPNDDIGDDEDDGNFYRSMYGGFCG